MSSDKLRFQGVVQAARGNGFFSVGIDIDNGEKRVVLCQLSGKMRTKNIKVIEGDVVSVELDTFDMQKGRVVYRKG